MTRAVDIEGRGVRVNRRSVGVGSAIPDSENLQNHYDAQDLSGFTDGETVSTIPDRQGNTDLSATGDPVYRPDGINSNPGVELDGESEKYTGDTALIFQPLTIYAVIVATQDSSNYEYVYDSIGDAAGRDRLLARWNPDNGVWEMQSSGGSALTGGATASPIIISSLSDGSNSVLAENGSDTSGDAGTNDHDGLTVGATSGTTDNVLNGQFGELLVYDAGHDAATRDDVEAYLSDKWGITV